MDEAKELYDPPIRDLWTYLRKWHEAKELRIWIFVIASWVVIYPITHFAFDPWGWNPLSEGFLGRSSWQAYDIPSGNPASNELYGIKPKYDTLFDNRHNFPAFFIVWLLPIIAFFLRHTYARFVK